MKKGILLFLLLATPLSWAMADDYIYPYLLFTDKDGVETTVSVNELVITFSDGQLVVTNGDGTVAFPLASLATMKFTDTATTTAVECLPVEATGTPIEVFTVAGTRVGIYESEQQARLSLKRGLYVIKSKNKTYKLSIR